MVRKIASAAVIAAVSVITTLLVQSILGSHSTSAAGRPKQTTQPCVTTRAGAAVGTVKSVSGNTLTITDIRGTTVTVTVSPNTTYRNQNGAAKLSDISAGAQIVVRGTSAGANAINATAITIIPQHAEGKVTKISGGTLTIQPLSARLGGLASQATTVTTTTSTKFVGGGTANPGLGSIKVGSFIVAQGTLSSDGKTLTATRVMIGPAMGSGPGPRGLWMRPNGVLPHMFGAFGGWHHWSGTDRFNTPASNA